MPINILGMIGKELIPRIRALVAERDGSAKHP